KGLNVEFEDILKNISERDSIDSVREISPLKKADDAYVLDNSNMTINQQMDWFRKILNDKYGK
ncbi:MAG TPA: cytidylate kinase, partial [Desulfobacteraceae bacterium]|nr:cytidylate kinase [Desulfobacteraceae bacterium]